MATAQSSPPLLQPPPAAVAADYNLRILWPIARYFEDRLGHQGLQALAAAGGLVPSDFDAASATSRWGSARSFEAILAPARAQLGSDDAFMRACIHRIQEAYGPLRYVLWATSPGAVFNQAASQYALVSTCGDLVMSASGPTSTHCHF